MKHLAFLLFLSLPALLSAQSYCDYDKLYREGKAFAKKRQYKMALYKFNSARRCDPSKGEPVDAAIEALLDQIEGEKKTADRERERAEKALEEVKKATGKILDNILRDADNDIYHLDYEAALEKIKSAVALGVEQQKVSDALLELVFWYAETSRSAQALGVLDTAARLIGRENEIAPLASQMPGDSAQARRLLRAAIRRLNPRRDSFLQERYFPVMIAVKGGEFQMGSENGAEFEKPVHAVRLSDFQMARSETTWWQYNLFCAASGHNVPEKPAGWGGEGDNPVINVSWYDAVAYSNWLSRREGLEAAITGSGDNFVINLVASGYRLPTEAEWEYAARGGDSPDSTEYSGSNDINEVGWCGGRFGGRSRSAMQKKPNGAGLYDMSGNVKEWCRDWYGEDYYAKCKALEFVKNPQGPDKGESAVSRGGSWYPLDLFQCRVSVRNWYVRSLRVDYNGFRLARAAPAWRR